MSVARSKQKFLSLWVRNPYAGEQPIRATASLWVTTDVEPSEWKVSLGQASRNHSVLRNIPFHLGAVLSKGGPNYVIECLRDFEGIDKGKRP